MRALVLSGGSGTRLRPITHTSAKQLVPVANKPVLFYGLEAIAAAGITDVGIVVGDTAEEISGRPSATVSMFGLAVTYIPQEQPLGACARGVDLARLPGRGRLLSCIWGDNFIVGGIKALVDEFPSVPAGGPRSCSPKCRNPADFGVAEFGRPPDRSYRWRRSLQRPRVTLARSSASISLRRRCTKRYVRSSRPTAGKLEITHAIQWLIDERPRCPVHPDHRLLEGHRQCRRHARGQSIRARTCRRVHRGHR